MPRRLRREARGIPKRLSKCSLRPACQRNKVWASYGSGPALLKGEWSYIVIRASANPLRVLNRLIILVFFAALLYITVSPWGEPGLKKYGNHEGMLDMRPGYGSGEIQTFLRSLGKEGRSLYSRLLLVDLMFTLSFISVQNNLFRRLMGDHPIRGAGYIPLVLSCLRGGFDTVENALLLLLIRQFHNMDYPMAVLCGPATLLKFICLGLWLICLPAVPIIIRYKERRQYDA